MAFLCNPKRKETAIKFIQIISIIKSETLSLPTDFPKTYLGYIRQISDTIHVVLHPLPSLLALFLEFFCSYFGYIMVNS